MGCGASAQVQPATQETTTSPVPAPAAAPRPAPVAAPAPAPATVAELGGCPASIAAAFLKACEEEYVKDSGPAVGDFFNKPEHGQYGGVLDPFESRVRSAKESGGAAKAANEIQSMQRKWFPSAEVPSAPKPTPAAQQADPAKQGFVACDNSGSGVKGQLHLPFVRFDKTAVPKEISHGDEVYVSLVYRGGFLSAAGGDVRATPETADAEVPHHFLVERRAGAGPLSDGDEVLLRCVQTGMHLEAHSDSEPLTAGTSGSDAAVFKIYKQGRPTTIKHRDLVFLTSWLSNYVGVQGDGTFLAKRWVRGEGESLSILKKAVIDNSSTELARRMQFQAFDLDGNGSISRGEMEYMMTQLRGDQTSEQIDVIMGYCDPAHTGQVPFPAFASWCDGDTALKEEELHHAEVLGNVAQRCNDCLKEENCLIEVLSVAHHEDCQKMLDTHKDKFKECLVTSVVEKASSQDGWIFSNYWKTTMKALLEDEVSLWSRALNDAMRGLGTDEDTLTALICTMPDRLREGIFSKYTDSFGRTLLEHIESETSFSYKRVLVYQALSPEHCRARILNEAMVGMGTSEDQLIRVITQADLGERRQIKETYAKIYGRDLIEHVKSETSGDFKKALVCLLEAEEVAFDLDADCAAMKKAMDGWGTDEEALVRLICSKTPKQMADVNVRFESLYGKSLLTRVESETSGNFQATLLGTIRGPMKELAHSVRYCMKGWGTDDRGLITLLVHLPDFKKLDLIAEYKNQFGSDLIEDIKADTSGDYERALCSLVRPAPEIWAEALLGAMKGLGTSDELLINFLVIAKDEMAEVRKAFSNRTGKALVDWLDSETSGDYKKTLIALAARNSEDRIDLMPTYWMQRCRDAVRDIDSLKDILVSFPAVAIKRGTEVFAKVYGRDLRKSIEEKCGESSSFFRMSSYWKHAMLALLDMPVERYVKGFNDAMKGWGTDEFTLTALVCTMPENLYDDIKALYVEKHGKTLMDHITSETSFSYKKALEMQTLSWAESRCKALNGAMVGLGTSEKQLIRVIICSTMGQRRNMRQAYQDLYGRDLIEHVQSETSGSFKNILTAVLESNWPQSCDLEADCKVLKEAMDGCGTDEEALVRILASKTDMQLEQLKEKFQELYNQSLFERVNNETWDWGMSVFRGADFRTAMLYLLREPTEALTHAVRDCIAGWGTDDTGLITLLTHLSERKRRDLCSKYEELFSKSLEGAIKSDTSGSYEGALLALIQPAPKVWARAMTGAMKGVGTSDELLINWLCIAKDRMEEVREEFRSLHDGAELAGWIDGECNGDYKDTLIRLANRKCYKFAAAEACLTIQAPPDKDEAVIKFNKVFNRLCRQKKQNPPDNLVIPEDAQQEMGSVFAYFADLSSCAPDMDKQGLWDMTNACGFPPADNGPDLDATFSEWNYSGTGQITWNDFVRQMAHRVNDPGHYNAHELAES